MSALDLANRVFHGWLLALLVLFYSAALCAEPAVPAKPLTITIVQSEGGGSYGEFSDTLRQILGESGLVPVIIDASQPIPNSVLVIAVGIKAATVAAASNAPTVLNVFIPKAGHEKLLHDFPRRADTRSFSTIYLDQPIHRQVGLISAIAPGMRNVGLLYASLPDEIVTLRNELAGHGLAVQEQNVNPAHPLATALQEILQRSDVLLVLPDAEVYNSTNIRNILLAAYRSNIPLIGISAGYVKAGALCAVVSTPMQIAAQTALLIRQFHDSHALPAAQYPQAFEVMVNGQVARSLNLQIRSPAELQSLIGTRSTP